MTLIECFDPSITKNIIGCMHLKPKKVIFLGDSQQMHLPLGRIRRFLAAQNFSVQVASRHVIMDQLSMIVSALRDILQQEEPCVIDVSGGDERMLIAVGMVLAGLDEQTRTKVSVQKFDLSSGTVLDCDGDGQVLLGHPIELEVADLIALHGGVIHPVSPQPSEHDSPRDLEPLWTLAADHPRLWNRQLSTLAQFESRADSKTHIFLSLPWIQSSIPGFDEKLELMEDLLHHFRDNNIIYDYSRRDSLEYEYTTELNRYCTLKAGNVLEVKVLLEARAMLEDGKPFFHDCQISTHIDWDGIVYDTLAQIPETRNEIDLILTRGITPLFISCKNGDVDEDELYKLNTVADQFGGPSAKKMLISTRLQKKSPLATQAFIQRAKDMGIHLVANAADLSQEQWREIFRDAMM